MKKKYSILMTILITMVSFCYANAVVIKAFSGHSLNQGTDSVSLEDFLTKDKGYVKIQMAKMPTGHLQLNATLNGVSGNFILDTGAGGCVVEAKSKNKFKLKTDSITGSAVGAGGLVDAEASNSNTLTINNLVTTDCTIYIVSLSNINEALVQLGLDEIEGVIGADLLTSRQGIIDYSNLILYLKK